MGNVSYSVSDVICKRQTKLSLADTAKGGQIRAVASVTPKTP